MGLSESDKSKLSTAAKDAKSRLPKDGPPVPLGKAVDSSKAVKSARGKPVDITPEQQAAMREREERNKREERERMRRDYLTRVLCSVGQRYADCDLKNYQCTTDAQTDIVIQLEAFGKSIQSGEAIENLVLFGPVGTGKDHLLVAMMKVAALSCKRVVWINGMDLYAAYRDAIDGNTTEQQLVTQYTAPDVLVLSDPVPPWGEITPGQAAFLFRILDRRYRDMKAVWCSLNTRGGDEAIERMSAQLVDRLKDGALCLRCNWPSYRKPKA